MSQFKTAFTPALNKEGYSRLEFKGLQTLAGKAGETSTRTGEVYVKDWEINTLTFSCKGMIKNTSQDIKITIPTKYSEGNVLARLLANLGYVAPTLETVIDDEGFEVVETDEDADGFAEVEDLDLGIDSFLESIVDKVFIAKVFRATEGKNKGQWTIDIDTIQPFVKK